MSKSRWIDNFGRVFRVLPACIRVVLLCAAGAGAILCVGTAQANVEFARMTGQQCSACHLGDRTPTNQTLNKAGNEFAACRLDDSCIHAWRVSMDPRPAPSPSPPAPSLPSGSYRSSCDTVRMVDGVLSANCRSADQTMRQTSLASPFACANGVANADGHLACGKAPAPAALPTGSFAHSCTDIRVVDDVLSATCKRPDQSARESSLQRPFACAGGIDNIDGRLTCRTPAAPPPGPVMWGAIAAADGRNDAAGVVDSSGTGTGATRQDAEAAALTSCGGTRCNIEISFQGGCGAYASSHKHSGSGTGQTLAVAAQQALGNCNKNACRVAVQFCPGH